MPTRPGASNCPLFGESQCRSGPVGQAQWVGVCCGWRAAPLGRWGQGRGVT